MIGLLFLAFAIVISGFSFFMRDEGYAFGVNWKDGWTWQESSEVKCRKAPAFSKHAEFCIPREPKESGKE